jgi:CRP/FNR family transcriptional regulator
MRINLICTDAKKLLYSMVGDATMNPDVAAKIESFFAPYRLRKYAKGQILMYNGDTTDYIYYLVKGKVKEYDVTYRGDEIILNVFKTLAFFPMSIAVNKKQNPYTYEAETDVEVRLAPITDVLKFIVDNPDVMYDLLSRVYRGLDGILGRMARLMSSSARSRLLYELVVETNRFGIHRDDGSISVEINEKNLGARAGLTRETISREIRKLKDEAIVAINSKDIVILDYSRLEAELDRSL